MANMSSRGHNDDGYVDYRENEKDDDDDGPILWNRSSLNRKEGSTSKGRPTAVDKQTLNEISRGMVSVLIVLLTQ